MCHCGKGKCRNKQEHEVALVDSDNEEPMSNRAKHDLYSTVQSLNYKVEEIKEDVDSMKDAIQEILHLNNKAKLTIGLQRILRFAFRCKICLKVPITPPIIMSKCCKTVIGCEGCVNTWYSGPEALIKTCPSCRAERGYSETMLLRGMDSFLAEVGAVLQAKEEEESDEI